LVQSQSIWKGKASAMKKTVPDWAECDRQCCRRKATWSVIKPWGASLLCGWHVKDESEPKTRLPRGGWETWEQKGS
jgi:hypothetical protein